VRAGEDRIVTIPNVISVVRLACIPVFLWLLFVQEDRLEAAWLLAALGATDWVDGYIARHFDQVSTVGKILDPTADRLMLAVGVIALMVDGAVPGWVGVLTLVREVLVSAAVLLLAALGARRIDVQWVGKAGTFALMFAYPFFLLSHAGTSVDDPARAAAWFCAIPGLVLSYYAAATYVPLARRALVEGRAQKEVPVP
jgi:cardiolipin synthase